MNSDIVDKQVKAFNDKDIETFMSCYSEDIHVSMLETGDVLTEGMEQLRKSMEDSFKAKPKSETLLIERIKQKDLVINLEKILNYVEGKVVNVVSIYEVKEGKISRLWFSNRTIEDE